MNSINLVFPGEPLAIQSDRSGIRNGRIFHFQPKRNTNWKDAISWQARSQLPQGFKPLDGYIALGRVMFVFKPIESLSKADKLAISQGFLVLKNTKPDMSDNLFKGLLDALQGIVYTNDSKICIHTGDKVKAYGEPNRIEIELSEIHKRIIEIPKKIFG